MLEKRLLRGALFLVWIQPTCQFQFPSREPARFSNIKQLYYSSGLKEYLRSPEFNVIFPGNDALLDAYDKWRIQYNKGEYSPERFENFKLNYMTLLTANAATVRRSQDGGPLDFPSYMSLNEYGDCSIEEYKKIMASVAQSKESELVAPVSKPSVPQDQQISGSYGASGDPLEWDVNSGESTIEQEIRNEQAKEYEIRASYEAWCQEKGKPFDESRLPIFAEHYLNAVEYCAQTNKPLKLNEYADLTTSEYNALSFHRPQQKEPTVSPFKKEQAVSFKAQQQQVEPAASFNGGQQQKAPETSFSGQQQQPPTASASFNGQQQTTSFTWQEQPKAPEDSFSEQQQQPPSAPASFNGQQQRPESTASFTWQQQRKAPEASFSEQQQQPPTASAPFNRQQQPPQSTASFNGGQQQKAPEASFKEKGQAQSKDSFNGQPQASSSPKPQTQKKSWNAGISTGSYLDTISKGKITGTYFGDKPELKEEDLASLFSKLSEAKVEEEEAKIQARRAEIAALEAGEVARIKEEEHARLSAAEEARQQALGESRLKAWQEARQKAELEAKRRAQGLPPETSEAPASPPAVPFRPMSGSYMGAVAKTWKSRSEYLAQLQASTKYLESLQNLPASELPKMYDQLDALTSPLPIISPTDADSKQVVPTLQTVEDLWEDEKVEEAVEPSIPKTDELKDTVTTLQTETKETVDASTRRQRDEMAARKAREEAEQWMRIQKQLEEQADLARERREREQKALLEAQKRAKELEAANLERERRLKEFQAMEGETNAKELNTIKQLQDSTEKAVQEAARLKAELEKLSKSKSPKIMSFFGNTKDGDSTKRNVRPSKQNQRFAAAHREREEVLNRMAAQERRKSFFDWFQNGSEDKSKTLASVTMWSLNDDGSITGIVERSSSFDKGVRITTSPVLGKTYEGAVVITASGNRYQLGEKETSFVGGANAADFFMGFFDALQKNQKAALLFDWKVNKDGTLTGIVSKKKGFNDGAKITTSPVIDEIEPGKVVRTLGGSYYRLL